MSEPAEWSGELRQLRETIDSLERRVQQLEQLTAELRANAVPPAQQRLSNWLNETRPDLAPRPVPPSAPMTPIPLARVAAGAPPGRVSQSLRPGRSLESIIGQNWASWIGAVVLFLGIVFFLKYAWDRGWIQLSPAARVTAAIVLGVVLCLLGERMHYKRLRVLSGSLYGAGVAVTVASLFSAYAYFEPPVLGRNPAFIGVALVAGLATGLSLHINVMPVAIVALLGAYLSPLVLRSGRDESTFLLAYLGVLSLTGWWLCHHRSRWRLLRWFVVVATYLSLLIWWVALGQRHNHDTLALIWTSVFYCGFLGEAMWTLRRRGDAAEASGSHSLLLSALPAPSLDINIAVTSLVSSAAAFASFLLVLGSIDPRVAGSLAIGMAGLQMLAALATTSRAFFVSSILQSAALVTISVPLLSDDFVITLAWMLLAAALGTLAWQLNLPAARWWGATLLVLSVARLLLLDRTDPTMRAVQLTLHSQPVTLWMLMGVSIAVLFHLLAWMRPTEARFAPAGEWFRSRLRFAGHAAGERPGVLDYASPPRVMRPLADWLDSDSVLLAVLGTGLFAVVVRMQWDGATVTAAMIAWLCPIVLLVPWGSALAYGWHAAILGSLCAVRWVVSDNLIPLMELWHRGAGLPPLLNISAICGLVLVLAALAVWYLDRKTFGHVPLVVAGALGFAWCNFELWRTIDWLTPPGSAVTDRAIMKQVGMSVMWGSLGFSGVILGFRRRIPVVRYAALTLLGITLMKILIVDMSEVRAVWRILSFIAVGALLLGVSFVYQRQSRARATDTL